MKVVAFVYISLLTFTVQGLFDIAFPTTCDNGWLPDNGYCYLIAHYSLTFSEAENYCRQHSGHLIEIYSDKENAFIKDRVRYLKSHCYWIGLTDEMVEGQWKWYTTKNDANFTDWDVGQPDSYRGGNEDCALFWYGFDYKWADLPCNNKCTPVCKRRGYGFDNAIIG